MKGNVTKERRSYRKYLLSVSLLIGFFLTSLFFGAVVMSRTLINEEIRSKAIELFNSIVMARKWNAGYGGVFIEKKEGMESSPYLKDPDIHTVDGRVFTMKNPALMTREISEYASREGLFSFRITSLNLMNPDNAPDEFERGALLSFERGEPDASVIEKRGARTVYRFMAPLHVDETCLECHAEQGYSVGDIRGGISVTIAIDDIQKRLKRNSYAIVLLGVVSALFLLGGVFVFTDRLMNHLSSARKKIEKMAITDDLTSLFNRRHIISEFGVEFERAKRLNRDLGVILIDIDFFKKINDTFGHLAGDKVLKEVAVLVRGSIRAYDVLGRYGGEEFLIIMPEASVEETKNLAERIRRAAREDKEIVSYLTNDYVFSVSLGIANMMPEDQDIDDILSRADKGLYKAKREGRDRVGSV